MAQSDETTNPADVTAAPEASVAPAAAAASKARAAKPKTTRTLPTDRIAFGKQIEIVRAYGMLGATGRAVTNAEVATMVSLHPSTTSLANAFFNEVGLLQRSNDGQAPAAEAIAFARAHAWDPDTAAAKLGPLLAGSWFGLALLPKVQFRPHSFQEALTVLADAAGASIDHKAQLESVLHWLNAAGLVTFDGDTVRPVRVPDSQVDDGKKNIKDKETDKGESRVDTKSTGTGPKTPGAISFQLAIDVSMAEVVTLSADKIAAFFGGIAQVMQIQAEIEAVRNGQAPSTGATVTTK